MKLIKVNSSNDKSNKEQDFVIMGKVHNTLQFFDITCLCRMLKRKISFQAGLFSCGFPITVYRKLRLA